MIQRQIPSSDKPEDEQEYRLLFEKNPYPIWVYDIETLAFLTVNAAAIQQYGYSKAEFLSMTVAQIHPAEDHARLQAFVSQTVQFHPDGACLSEWRHLKKDGTPIEVETFSQASQFRGRKARLVCATDITSRKQIEAEMQARTLQSRLLAEVTLKIRPSLQLQEVLKTTVTEIQRILQADRVLIYQLDGQLDGAGGRIVQESVVAGYAVMFNQTIADPCFQDSYLEQYRQGRISAIADLESAPVQPCHVAFLQQFQVQANLVVPILLSAWSWPLQSKLNQSQYDPSQLDQSQLDQPQLDQSQNNPQTKLWGLLIAHQCSGPRHWSNFELNLLKQLANQVGIALTQSQLIETLHAQNDRLNLALDATQTGLWDWDMLTNQVVWTPHHEILFGYPPGTPIRTYDDWASRVHPEDLPITEAKIRIAMRTRQEYTCEYRVRHPDGSLHWVSALGRFYYSPEGRPLRMLGMLNDVTDRKQAETALRELNEELEDRVQHRAKKLAESEARFRSAFDHAVSGMAIVGLAGQFLKVNSALCQLLGYPELQLLPKTLETITYQADRDRSQRFFTELFGQELPSGQIELRYLHQQGYVIWVLCGASLVRDSQDTALYFVLQIQDVTEQREIERTKREFISVVSHELRTPLASIRGSLGLLAAGLLQDEPETAQQMLEISAHQTERLVRLVNDILDLERLETHKVMLNQQWHDSSTLIQQAITALQPVAQEHSIALIYEPAAVAVWGDSDRVVQVLINLISNAIKFSPPQSVVTITTRSLKKCAVLQVQDCGIGIPADRLKSIFGRFQQVNTSDARDKGGTGLGLAISRNIVQQHGGNIWVDSTLGEGSIFSFTLPYPVSDLAV